MRRLLADLRENGLEIIAVMSEVAHRMMPGSAVATPVIHHDAIALGQQVDHRLPCGRVGAGSVHEHHRRTVTDAVVVQSAALYIDRRHLRLPYALQVTASTAGYLTVGKSGDDTS